MEGKTMLEDADIYAVVPASDLVRAREFYSNKLGLEPAREVPDGLVYEGGSDSCFLLYQTSNAGTAKNTAMGWTIDDLDAAMKELADKGVTFEKYDLPGSDPETGVVTADNMRAAWFRDSEGNVLCLSETN